MYFPVGFRKIIKMDLLGKMTGKIRVKCCIVTTGQYLSK